MNGHNHTDKTGLDPRTIELLNAHIDGEINASDQQELDKLLQGSSEIRNSLEELKAVTQKLSQAPELDPPEHLQNSIERQVRLPVKTAEKPGFLASLMPSQWLRTGLAVSLGLVVTIGIFELGSVPMSSNDAAKMVGTVAKTPNQNQPILLNSINLNEDKLSGLVEMKSVENQLHFVVQLQSQSTSTLVIHFAENGLEFESIEPPQDQIFITENSVSVSADGQQNYTLNFKRKTQTDVDSPVSMEFFADSSLIYEAKVSLSQP